MGQNTHHSLQTGTIPGSSEVAHRPDGGPQTSNAAQTRQGHSNLDISSRETELVPAAHHAAFIVQLVGVLPRECDLESPVLCCDGSGVVPLEVACLPVVEVGSFPEGIVAGIETPSVVVEFVRKDQLEF